MEYLWILFKPILIAVAIVTGIEIIKIKLRDIFYNLTRGI